MKRFLTLACAGMALLLLGACATPPTPYQPGPPLNTFGYSQDQIDANTWRVSFNGNSVTSRFTVEDYLLYRSAEIAVESGADGFVVLQDTVETNTSYRGTTSYPYSPFYYGGFAYGGYRRPYYGYGFGYGPGFGYTDLRPVNSYTAFAKIRLFKEFAPEGLGPAYDARAILQTIGRKIIRPQPSG